jgi:hypothetical protein
VAQKALSGVAGWKYHAITFDGLEADVLTASATGCDDSKVRTREPVRNQDSIPEAVRVDNNKQYA